MISVCLLGAGNVAHNLFNALIKCGNITVNQWYNKSIKNIESHKNETEITDRIKDLKEADIYIICVSDDAIASLSEKLPFKNRLVVHTSGSIGIHDLHKDLRRGVFYPLQSFTKDHPLDFSSVPICLETLNKEDFEILTNLANLLGCKSYRISTEQRQTLHLCAVFVNNFTNHIYRIAHEISDSKSIDFELLQPLILETAKKVSYLSPYQAQTGPAIRGDKKTIKKHLKNLEKDLHKDIYELLTKSIKSTHGR